MIVLLISSTLIIAAITGFVFFSEREVFCGIAGETLHGIVEPCMFR
jgi:hypothetical protein